MSTPTAEEIRRTLERHVQYWNEGRFDDWLALFPEDVVNESPAGTTTGRDAGVGSWEAVQGTLRLGIRQMAVLGNRVAAVVSNTGTYYGQEVDFDSIEV